jgi:hypothetical protein
MEQLTLDEVFSFTEDDLAANRLGRSSANQLDGYKMDWFGWLVLFVESVLSIINFVLMIWAIVFLQKDMGFPVALCFQLGIAAGCSSSIRLFLKNIFSTIQLVRNAPSAPVNVVSVDRKDFEAPKKDETFYTWNNQRIKLGIHKKYIELLKPDKTYLVYYLPIRDVVGNNILLSLEEK